jgi:hypothetical protein
MSNKILSAASRVKWLKGEKPNVSRTISVLVLRLLRDISTLMRRTKMVLETSDFRILTT